MCVCVGGGASGAAGVRACGPAEVCTTRRNLADALRMVDQPTRRVRPATAHSAGSCLPGTRPPRIPAATPAYGPLAVPLSRLRAQHITSHHSTAQHGAARTRVVAQPPACARRAAAATASAGAGTASMPSAPRGGGVAPPRGHGGVRCRKESDTAQSHHVRSSSAVLAR